MKLYFRIFVGLLIMVFGYLAVKKASAGYELGLFHELQYLPFCLLLILTLATLMLDSTYYKIDKQLKQYSISLLGIAILLIATVKLLEKESIDNSKSIMNVSNRAGASNVLTFEFKENDRFKLTEIDRLSQTVFYGKYHKSNDTLTIVQSNYKSDNVQLPRTGIIRMDTVFWNSFDTMIIVKE